MQNLFLVLFVVITFVFTIVMIIMYFQMRLMKERWALSATSSKKANSLRKEHKSFENQRSQEVFVQEETNVAPMEQVRTRRSQKVLLSERAMLQAEKEAKMIQQIPVVVNPVIEASETVKDLENKEKFLFKGKIQKQITFLQDKELELCYYVWKSYNGRQISEVMNLNHATVRVTKNKVRQKLGLNSSTELRPFLIEMVRE